MYLTSDFSQPISIPVSAVQAVIDELKIFRNNTDLQLYNLPEKDNSLLGLVLSAREHAFLVAITRLQALLPTQEED